MGQSVNGLAVSLSVSSTQWKPGDEIEAKFLGVDRKNRTLSLSVKAKDIDEESAAIRGYAREAQAGTATLGDILKQQMEEAAKD